MTKATKKGMRENPLYQKDNKETEDEGIAKAWNKVDREVDKGAIGKSHKGTIHHWKRSK